MTERVWAPSQFAMRRLRQFGYTNGQIKDLLRAYLRASDSLHGNLTDDNFCSFCLKNRDVPFSVSPPDTWQPSPSVAKTLADKSIPETIWKQYIDDFINQSMSAHYDGLALASWDQRFILYVTGAWDTDIRNPSATRSFMTNDWYPDESTVKHLLEHHTTRKHLDLLVAEYRLYWCERRETKPHWSKHFRWWAQTQKVPSWLHDEECPQQNAYFLSENG